MSNFRRLQSVLLPKHYNLELFLDILNNSITGTVAIETEINKDYDLYNKSKTIELHSDRCIEITSVSHNSNCIFPSLKTDPSNQRISLEAKNIPENSDNLLKIGFQTNFRDNLNGFYKSNDYSVKASTLFCATEARTCFPCFDEPDLKASFEVDLHVKNHDQAKTVLSNTPEKVGNQIEEKEGYKSYSFSTTPVMSSYLLTFIIGNLDFYQETTNSGITVRCYTPENKSEHGKLATSVARKALDFYEDYFGMPYPLKGQNNEKKLDMVPLKECSVGAMENWGIVTYRESRILFDEKVSSYQDKETIILIVAHELAHQWFGNLTTMKWWTEIWLNEGFATFCQYLCADVLFPELKFQENLITNCLSLAFNLDKLSTSHAVEININDPSEISQVFDAISYQKGASIIRMMYFWIGPENFKKGLQAYFVKFAYGNARTVDLWEKFEEASGLPVKKVMSTWTSQKGFPVIYRDEKNPNKLMVENNTWEIPIFYKEKITDSDDQIKIKIMSGNELLLSNDKSKEPFILNPNRYGFYRIIDNNYTKEDPKTMNKIDKLKYLSDLFYAFEIKKLSVKEYWKFVTDYVFDVDETSSMVLIELLSHIDSLQVISASEELFDKRLTDFLKKPEIYSNLDIKIKSNAAKMIVKGLQKGEENIVQFDQLDSKLPKMIFDLKFNEKLNSESSWKSNYNQKTATEKQMFAQAIINSVSNNQKLIDWILSDDVAKCDKPYYLISLANQGRLARNQVWQKVLVEKADYLNELYGQQLFLLPRVYKGVLDRFNDYSEIESFVSSHNLEAAKQGISQGIEAVQTHQSIFEFNRTEFGTF